MKLKVLLFFLLAFFCIRPVFAGNDITITCNSGSSCTKSSELPLFSETNISPGFTHSQFFYIDNNRNGTCHLKLKAVSTANEVSDILSQKILINISGINNDYSLVDYSLGDLLDPTKAPISLGHVLKDQNNKYSWSVIFDKNAGNEYQSLVSNFNINFNFECDEEPGDTNTSDNPTSNQVTAGCANSAPDAPTRLIAYRNDDGSIRLAWTETTSTHDNYLIAFGTSPGVYQYGAPKVGDVSSYTVNSLTPGAQYCFYVRSLNGCMPGGRTPEYCVNSGSTVIPTNIIPTGFEPGVLGESTENNSSEVLGSENNCKSYWLPLLFIAAFLINLIYIRHSKKYKLIPFLISLVAFIIDKFILNSRCCFGPSWLCNYFWVGNILSWLIPTFAFKRKRNKIK